MLFRSAWVAWLLYAAILFCAACLLSKRLHDRGRAGWRAFVPVIALFFVWPQPQGVAGALGCVVLAFALPELFLLPGRKGFNRFG